MDNETFRFASWDFLPRWRNFCNRCFESDSRKSRSSGAKMERGIRGGFFFFFVHVRSCFQSKRQFSRGLSFKFLKLDCI